MEVLTDKSFVSNVLDLPSLSRIMSQTCSKFGDILEYRDAKDKDGNPLTDMVGVYADKQNPQYPEAMADFWKEYVEVEYHEFTCVNQLFI